MTTSFGKRRTLFEVGNVLSEARIVHTGRLIAVWCRAHADRGSASAVRRRSGFDWPELEAEHVRR